MPHVLCVHCRFALLSMSRHVLMAWQVIGCRALCKALDQGWIGHFVDTVRGETRAPPASVSSSQLILR
jgi:hypothetical protein